MHSNDLTCVIELVIQLTDCPAAQKDIQEGCLVSCGGYCELQADIHSWGRIRFTSDIHGLHHRDNETYDHQSAIQTGWDDDAPCSHNVVKLEPYWTTAAPMQAMHSLNYVSERQSLVQKQVTVGKWYVGLKKL